MMAVDYSVIERRVMAHLTDESLTAWHQQFETLRRRIDNDLADAFLYGMSNNRG